MAKDLSDNQKDFMIHLLSSNSIGEASDKTGIAKATGYGYMQDEHFKSEYDKIRRDKFEKATSRIVDLVDEATEVMQEIMTNEDEIGSTRVNAVKAIWANAFKTYELQEIDERLERIESLLEDGKP